eukprot:GHVU01098023.1.p1 GENE.GHVU01098023.1~~GHVU01098023.1.p1  ORF type:complete len:101 (+),score=16.57 GHVU01098023.1:741-1043(+)
MNTITDFDFDLTETTTSFDTKDLFSQLLERIYTAIDKPLRSAETAISTLKDSVNKPSRPNGDGDVPDPEWTRELAFIDSTLLEASTLLDSLPKHSSVLQG